MNAHSIDVGGLRLRAVEAGAGAPVLVLHGFTGDAESMESVSEGLRASYRVVRLELVGHGGSDSPEDIRFYSMPDCARQIAVAVAGLDLERPHLLGYSMGGRAALAAAIAHPNRFASLVLVGATAGIADARMRDERIQSDRHLADRIETEGLDRFVDEWMALPIFASQSRLGEDALGRARAQRLRNSEHGLANSLRGMGAGAQFPLFEELRNIKIPVLLVVGDEDEKFKAIAEALEARLPDARTAILPRAGHAAHLEAPAEFASHVSDFLADIPVAPSPRLEPSRTAFTRSQGDRE
jgi:2-succinyl-6-hydroxy-2,4-cyclohexadiene-1-carboxylate synthase